MYTHGHVHVNTYTRKCHDDGSKGSVVQPPRPNTCCPMAGTNKLTDRQTYRHTDRQTDRQTERQTNKQTNKHTNTQASKQASRHTDKQTHKRTTNHTSRQTNKHTHKQTNKHANKQHSQLHLFSECRCVCTHGRAYLQQTVVTSERWNKFAGYAQVISRPLLPCAGTASTFWGPKVSIRSASSQPEKCVRGLVRLLAPTL